MVRVFCKKCEKRWFDCVCKKPEWEVREKERWPLRESKSA